MKQTPGSFAEADEALKSFSLSDIRLVRTLEHVAMLMDFLGHPQNRPLVIHVAGAQHKTPVTLRLAEHLHARGARLGVAAKRRMYLGLHSVDGADYYQAMQEFLTHVQHSGLKLTRDEILAAFQYWYFDRKRVDFIVVQAEGGVLDPSNSVRRSDKICVFAGMTDPARAEHEAGIVQPGNALFTLVQPAAVAEVIAQSARRNQADLHILGDHEALAEAAARWALGQEW